jgi:PRC-barrel domain
MIKRILVSTALGMLMISGGLAQSTKSGDPPKFVEAQNSDQWVFSKFKGTDVIGPNNETIGGVYDLLFDRSGKISGVVVGVGGFLGIGQKNVAIDMSAFEPVLAGSGNTQAPATRTNDPTNVKLKVAWTKDELQQAPDFRYFKPPAESASGKEQPSTTGMGQRPNPMAPLLPPQPK